MTKIIITLLACCALAQVRAADVTWLTNLSVAETQAKNQNKLVLMNFTGSDWCPWCIKMNKETLSQPEFTDYAKTNLVLVLVDFPAHKEQSYTLKVSNDALQKKYNIQSYPTLVEVKPDGKVVWTQVGYLEGGPKALIAQLDAANKK
jgi:thioredoxin-related protein